MKVSKNFVLKNVAGNYVVVPVGNATVDFNAIIHLNEVGAFIFKNLQENDCSVDDLVNCILKEYDTNEQQARNDVIAFCQKLKEHKMIE